MLRVGNHPALEFVDTFVEGSVYNSPWGPPEGHAQVHRLFGDLNVPPTIVRQALVDILSL